MNLDPGPSPHSHSNGTSASSRTVHMFPALAAPANESAPAEGSPNGDRDLHAEVKRVLTAATKPLRLAEIQAELGEPHVPEGPISAAIEALGSAVAKTFVDEQPRFAMAESVEATMARARAVLDIIIRQGSTLVQIEKKLGDSGTPYPEAKIVEDLGAWIAAGVVEKRETALEPLYQILETHCVASDNAALDSLMRVRFPEAFVDYEALAKKTEAALSKEREAHTATKRTLGASQQRIEQLVAWFHANKIPVPGVADARKEVFTWSQQRKVTPAEMKRISGERRALRIHKEKLVSQGKEDRSATKAAIDKAISNYSALEDAEGMSSYLLTKEAYKVVVDGKLVVYSADAWDFGAELDREDIPAPTAPTSAPPLIPPTDEIAEEASKVAAAIPPADPAVQAAADAANAREEKAAAVRGKGPKGEINLERYIAESSTLLQTKGPHGLSVDDAPHDVAACIFGRVHEKHKVMARQAIEKLVESGKVIERRGRVIWAELAEPDDGSDDEDQGPASGEQ